MIYLLTIAIVYLIPTMCQTLAYIVIFFNVEAILRNIYLITVMCWTLTYNIEDIP